MQELSDLRNFLLRSMYSVAIRDASVWITPREIASRRSHNFRDELIQLVVDELARAELIEIQDPTFKLDSGAKLTATGYYEAERLGGAFKTPATAGLIKSLKDYQFLGILIAFLGLVITIAYPEFKSWQADLDRIAAQNAWSNGPEVQMAKMREDGDNAARALAHAKGRAQFCLDSDSLNEIDGISCDLLRGNREPTKTELLKICEEYKLPQFSSYPCPE